MSSLWDRTQRLPNEYFKQVEMVYGDHFPLEVRFQLALWIEEKFFNKLEVKEEDPGSQNVAVQLAQQLLIELENKAEAIPNDPDKILLKKNLKEMSLNLRSRYQGNLVALYMKVRLCLEQELAIVSQASALTPGANVEQSKEQKIRLQLSTLKQRVNTTGHQLDGCRHEQEVVTSELYSFKEWEGKYSQMVAQHGENHDETKKVKLRRDKFKQDLEIKFNALCTARNTILNDIVFTVREVKEVQTTVLDQEQFCHEY